MTNSKVSHTDHGGCGEFEALLGRWLGTDAEGLKFVSLARETLHERPMRSSQPS